MEDKLKEACRAAASHYFGGAEWANSSDINSLADLIHQHFEPLFEKLAADMDADCGRCKHTAAEFVKQGERLTRAEGYLEKICKAHDHYKNRLTGEAMAMLTDQIQNAMNFLQGSAEKI